MKININKKKNLLERKDQPEQQIWSWLFPWSNSQTQEDLQGEPYHAYSQASWSTNWLAPTEFPLKKQMEMMVFLIRKSL